MCDSNNKPYSLEFFLNFDYVGAPWDGRDFFDLPKVYVGNGGFSLRNVSLTKYCLQNSGPKDNHPVSAPEDYYFAYCAQVFGRPAPYEMAKFFAIETEHNDLALGIHGVCTYSGFGCNSGVLSKWVAGCPDSSFLFPNNLCPKCDNQPKN